AIWMLNRELPVDDAIGAADQLGALEDPGRGNECFDDIATGLGITRQPAIFKTPSRRYPARVRHVVSHILGKAQPVNSSVQMIDMMVLGLRPRADEITPNQAYVPRTPRLVAKRHGEK